MNKETIINFLLVPILPFFTVSLFFVYQFAKKIITDGYPAYMNFLENATCLSMVIVAIAIGLMFLKSKSQSARLFKLCLIFGFLGIVQHFLTEPGRDYPSQAFLDWFALTSVLALVPSGILACISVATLLSKSSSVS